MGQVLKMNQSYGVYLAYYINDDVFPDGSSFDYAIIGSLGFSTAMVVAPIVTALIGRHDIHIPMLMGIVLQTSGLVAASFAQRIWQLFLTQGVLVGFGIGCTYIPTMGVLAQWFCKRRSLVYGMSSAGMGVGGLLFSFGARWITHDLGLSWSLRITGMISCLVNLLATCMIKSRNQQVLPSHDSFDTKLLCRYDVFVHLCFAFISMLGHIVVLFSLSDFAHSIGLTDDQAASVTAFLNLGIALGRPFTGILSDRFGRIETAGTLTFICGLTIFLFWLPATSYWACILFAFINGPVFGVYWVVSIPLPPES
jgi:MFS family permease